METKNEEWRDVRGFEGSYQVSNMGRVRSLDRYDGLGRLIKGMMLNPSINKGRGYLRVSFSDGHRNFKHYEVHRLVALHFVPGYQEGLVVNHKNEIKTDNRADNLEWCTYQYNINYSDVVAWKRKEVYQYDLQGNFIAKHKCCANVEKMFGTYQGAMVHVMYESKTKIWKGYRWSYEPKTKEEWQTVINTYQTSRKAVLQCDESGNIIHRYGTVTEAAQAMGVSITCISNCCKGKTIHAKGYRWRFE